MKRCPNCGTTYTDATLRFCLADGARLDDTLDSEPTVFMGRRDTVRVAVPTNAGQTRPLFSDHPASKSSSRTWIKALLAVLILGVLFVAVAGIAGAVYYFNSGESSVAANVAQRPSSPIPAASPTVDEEKKRLEDELANVKKRLEDQKKTASTNSDPFPNDDSDPTDLLRNATVNSPHDGFLALRSSPETDGALLAKVPHGAQVAVAMCHGKAVTIGGRTGKWCFVGWDQYIGWVFDAWLDYENKN